MYNIIRNGDNPRFVVLDNERPEIIFLDIEGIQDLEQQGLALIAKEMDNTYSIYLPSSWYEDGDDPLEDGYIDSDSRASCIISGVKSYVYMYSMLILQKDDYYVFIRPDAYALDLTEDGVMRKRSEALQKLYANELHIKHVLPGNHLLIDADDSLYLVEHCNDFENVESPQEIITKVKPFTQEENEELQSTLASVNPVQGYYCLDENSDIIKVKIFFDGISFIYTLNLDKPSKEIHLKSYNRVNPHFTISIWNVTFTDCNDEQLLIVTPKGRTTVKLETLF